MHRPAVPQNQITRLRAHFDDLAAPVLEPADFGLLEAEPICGAPWDVNFVSFVGCEEMGVFEGTHMSSRPRPGAP